MVAATRREGYNPTSSRRCAIRHPELYKALHKSPFEPFRIQLTNGESWVIRHPDFAALTRTTVYVGVSSGRDEIPDTFNEYDLLHVSTELIPKYKKELQDEANTAL